LRGRKRKVKERKGRKGKEARKEPKLSPCLGVKETNKERRWRVYVIILLFYPFFLLKSIHCNLSCNLFKTTYLIKKKY
jgi:hypothetical protein